MASTDLDEIDLKILRILQAEPEIAIQEIGARVGLSHTPCWRRIKKMQESGLLKGRVWLVDAEKAGHDVSIFVFVRLDTHSAEVMDAFEKATLDVPEILRVLKQNAANAQALVKALADDMPAEHEACPIGSDRALDVAIITAPDRRDPSLLAKLDAVAGRVLTRA